MSELIPDHEVIPKASSALKDASEAFAKSPDFLTKTSEAKIKALPSFAAKMNDHIQRASVYIKLLDETEWNSDELKAKAANLKTELEKVRTRLRYTLRQQLEPHLNKSLASLKARLPEARAKHQQGDSLDYVSILEEFAHLEIAKIITTPSHFAKAMKFAFGADVESAPEEVKDYFIHIDYSTLMQYRVADALTRYRKILEKKQTTKEKIMARADVKELEKRLLS